MWNLGSGIRATFHQLTLVVIPGTLADAPNLKSVDSELEISSKLKTHQLYKPQDLHLKP